MISGTDPLVAYSSIERSAFCYIAMKGSYFM